MNDTEPRIAATATIKLELHHESFPGIFTPDCHEPPSDYVVIRRAGLVSGEVRPGAAGLIEDHIYEGWGELDPDKLIEQALYSMVVRTVDPSGAPVDRDDFDEVVMATATQAGLEVMGHIIGILRNREELDEQVLRDLTPEDLSEAYDRFIGPAIDGLQAELERCSTNTDTPEEK